MCGSSEAVGVFLVPFDFHKGVLLRQHQNHQPVFLKCLCMGLPPLSVASVDWSLMILEGLSNLNDSVILDPISWWEGS